MRPPPFLLLLALPLACEPYPGTGGSSSGSSSGAVATDRQPIAAAALCNRVVNECKDVTTNVSDCVGDYTAVMVTRACADALATASCRELTTTGSAVLQGCFPRCSGALASCNADGTITTCTTSGTTTVFDCSAVCQANRQVYTGTCATTYQGQVGDRPQCWCR